MSSALFSPIDLRGVRFENRIVVSPMCQYSATDGTACDWHVVNLGHLSLSGPGLAFFEATHVSPEGRITPDCLGLYSDDNEAGMARVVAFLRAWTPTKIGVQLAHAGRKASTLPPWEGGGPVRDARAWTPVAPSAIPYDAAGNVPDALDAAGLQRVREQFANRRTDEYGGPLASRMRFPLELFDAVRAVWPERGPLGVRISATDYAAGGWNLDEAVEFSRALRERGCDFIDCSSGGLVPTQKIDPHPGYQVPFARTIRREAGIATMAIGMITDPALAERIVASGDADFVSLARGFLRDPRWVWDAADALGGEPFVPPQYLRGRRTSRP